MTAEPLYCEGAGGALVASPQTRGPWDPDMQHGGAPAALLADAVQALAPGMQIARMTFEFLGPVPIGEVAADAAIVRGGRRLQLAEATLTAGGRPALLARAMLLRRADPPLELPAAAGWDPSPDLPGRPEDGRPLAFPWETPSEEGFFLTANEMRHAAGSDFGRGARVWFRLRHPLRAGRPTPAVCRAFAAADFANGISFVLDHAEHVFINTDLSVHLVRDPVGEWVLMESVSRIDPQGVGQSSSTLYDVEGPIGFGHQSLYVEAR